jgi:hypothetical protein
VSLALALGFHLQCRFCAERFSSSRLPAGIEKGTSESGTSDFPRSYTNLRLKIFPRLSAIIALAILREKLQGNTIFDFHLEVS